MKGQYFFIAIALSYIVGCGTLGGIGKGYFFPVPKRKLESAMDSIFTRYPKYKISSKWKAYDDWSARGYNFLEGRIFYFDQNPEEMYYITFIGDSVSWADTNRIGIGIRAVFNGRQNWQLDNDLNRNERDRIRRRFQLEIISKIEYYLKKKQME